MPSRKGGAGQPHQILNIRRGLKGVFGAPMDHCLVITVTVTSFQGSASIWSKPGEAGLCQVSCNIVSRMCSHLLTRTLRRLACVYFLSVIFLRAPYE